MRDVNGLWGGAGVLDVRLGALLALHGLLKVGVLEFGP